ncbi:sodium transport ATPase [Eremomyces bilateralis CBS 781.70]|uniref:P-type Na(+) transporter n=1 Tax=Eremomyces bilateralis CBS 781.70 TaxID=1392243 RepID=A0A6G1G7C9_9PEZI|nr:sodium transport ATPase [Eremomyces bilateralis CBS 781.70]KAF1813912.1 sodium transport ATPase [Eremomyces bilateralis CBS 781.70]
MGIEDPIPEESSEPPICGQTKKSPHPHTTDDSGRPESNLSTESQDPTPNFTADDIAQKAHTLSAEQVAQLLDVNLHHGLSATEADARLRYHGPNKIKAAEGVSKWQIFLRQISNSLTIVLLITMTLSFIIDDYIEGSVIAGVITLNIIVGFYQDYNAEQTIASLFELSAPQTTVVRDGESKIIEAFSLVVGDVIQLTTGDIVPADVRLFEGINTAADEALLTGESLPVHKTPEKLFTSLDIATGDRTNLAFSASTITRGRAKGVVIATGMHTEVGKIADMLRSNGNAKDGSKAIKALRKARNTAKHILGLVGTPLQVKLSKFALLLFGLAILLAIIVFSVSKWEVDGEVLIYGICVAVAVIPESLIAVLTITFSVATKAMANSNVITRKLAALEAVGGTNHICSDKTQTITQGSMVAKEVWIPGSGTLFIKDATPFDPTSGFVDDSNWVTTEQSFNQDPHLTMFLTTVALCNLATVTNMSKDSASLSTANTASAPDTWTALGEPTEIALQVLATRFNLGKPTLLEDGRSTLAVEFPFESALKRMSVIYRNGDGSFHMYAKGAAEVLLPLLNISPELAEEMKEKVEELAAEGLRVLCVAHKPIPTGLSEEQRGNRDRMEIELDFLGLVGLYDPPRLETAGAVKKCQTAGVVVHMLTGDHIKTATSIAKEVGILKPADLIGKDRKIMLAADFDKLTNEEVDKMEDLPLVVARCSPSTKVRMVEALHRRKVFCVMTGDGINDSPALQRADVGIAMGKSGSDVAKEAADMVLTDDNFASIVKAIEEGRRLFDNIQKFLMHLLISNIAQVVLLLLGLAFKDDNGVSIFPLSPLEILWVNLITSSFLAIGLGLEDAQPDIMYRPPANLQVGVFTAELITDKFIYGVFLGSLCLVSFASVSYGAGGGNLGHDCNEGYNDSCDVVYRARATTYATLTFLLLVTAWEVKHFSRSLFNMDPSRHTGLFSVFSTLWRNRFLFWSVMAGFVICFPIVYIPVMNRVVFKHQGLTWEWGIVVGCTVVYTCYIEIWKAIKRRFGIWSGKHLKTVVIDAEKGTEKGARFDGGNQIA